MLLHLKVTPTIRRCRRVRARVAQAIAVLLLAMCGLLPTLVPAATAQRLYEAEISLEQRSGAARRDGELEALRAVLVKVSGRDDDTVDSILRDVGTDIADMVEQTQWRQPEGQSSSVSLWVRFDANAVEALLFDAGVSVWPRTRPRTILLAALDEAGVRTVLGADDGSPLPAAFIREAERRGLPFVLPLSVSSPPSV